MIAIIFRFSFLSYISSSKWNYSFPFKLQMCERKQYSNQCIQFSIWLINWWILIIALLFVLCGNHFENSFLIFDHVHIFNKLKISWIHGKNEQKIRDNLSSFFKWLIPTTMFEYDFEWMFIHISHTHIKQFSTIDDHSHSNLYLIVCFQSIPKQRKTATETFQHNEYSINFFFEFGIINLHLQSHSFAKYRMHGFYFICAENYCNTN